ncbi:MAG TPA: TetR/AcrR family transcriptional regulator [Pseudonocardia sp.]|jgi:AcrR family transcriptional regulator
MASTFDQVRAADVRRRLAAASETESAIFDATERLLATVALHDLNVAQVIEAAGISRATFYRYFTSKDAVVSGLLARAMDEVFVAIANFFSTEEPQRAAAPTALEAALSDAWNVFARHIPVMRAVSENWHRVPELKALWLSIVDRFVAAIAGQIDRERDAGLAPAGINSAQLAAMLVWSTERFMYIASGPEPGPLHSVEGTLPAVIVLWRQAIYGGTTADTDRG